MADRLEPDETPARPAPIVHCVPPPAHAKITRLVLSVPGLALALWGVCLLINALLDLNNPGCWDPTGRYLGASIWQPFVLLGTGAGLLVLYPLLHRHLRARRAAALESLPDIHDDPVARSLAARWHDADRPPGLVHIRREIEQHAAAGPGKARIVCLGALTPPAPGDYRFEPEVITSGRLLGPRRWWIPAAAAAVVALWILASLSGVSRLRLLGWSACPVYLAVVYGLMWLWSGAIRPTYVRLAPGVVQVLRYRWFWHSRPVVRSYPIDAHALAVVTRLWHFAFLWIDRRHQKDTILLTGVLRSPHTMNRLWHALLSTAPTPPLTEDGLLG